MPEQNRQEININQITEDAVSQIDQIGPAPFSPSGFNTLKEKISEYIVNLISESIKVSRRHQADTVSSNHVQRATEYLVSVTSRRFFRHLGTVGGILLGASLSNILSMAGTNQYTTLGVILSASLGITGAFLIALHIGKD